MNVEDIYRDQVENPQLGYRPVSSSIKSVHVANGLFRALLGTGPKLTAFHNTLVRFKDGAEIKTADQLAKEYGETIFGQFSLLKNHERLNLLREYLRYAYAADGAVFPAQKFSSYTLTHRVQITQDTNDFGTGKFIAKILTRDRGNGQSLLIKVINDLLDDNTDEFTTIALPLIGREKLSPSTASNALTQDNSLQSQSFILDSARLGFDAIAVHSAAHLKGSKLQILRYIVLFSCLTVYLHLINRNREANQSINNSEKNRLVAILVNFGGAGSTRIRRASQNTYRTAIKQIENLVLNGFREYLSNEYPNIDAQIAEDIISTIGLPRKSDPNTFKQIYNAYRAKEVSVLEALSAAMTDIFYKDRPATPDDFARSLGIRAGFVTPAANRAIDKYYTLTPDLIEVLILSVTNLEANSEAITFTELAMRLRDRYGIITGALPDDYDYLSREGIQGADHDDLEQNALAFQQTLIAIGKAREYADGIAIIRAGIGESL